MNKFSKILLSLVVMLFMTNILKAEEKVVIGLALPTQQEERWVRDLEAMKDEANKLGVDLKVQIARNDQMQQNNQVDQLLSQGVHVMIIAPHDGAGAAAAVEATHDEGIKAISYDRLILNTPVDVYISFDNVRVGELQGKWLTERAPKGNYVIMSGAPTDNNARLFKAGAMKYIQPLIDNKDINVVLEQAVIDWQPANAQKIIENALTKASNNIQAILAPNDGTASGAISALEAQGLAGKVFITGQDSELAAAQRIVQGTQGMTVFKDTRELGREAIRLAIKLAKNEDISQDTKNNVVNNENMDVPALLLTPIAVDKSNIDEVLINSGYLTKEDIYKN